MGSGGSKHKTGTPRTSYQPTDKPSIPGKPHLVPGSPKSDPDVITLRWDPPIFHGASKLIGYLVEHKRTGSPYWVKATPLLVKQNQLTLSGLEPGMRYQFRVTGENVHGRSEPSPLSEPLAISYTRGGVAVAPMFSACLCDTTAIENEKVEFLVKFEGMPAPKICWFKDGFEVFSNRRQRVSTDDDISSFVIHQSAITDEGEIKCTATNKAGHAVTKARLTLEAPPSIRLPRQYEDGLIFELGEIIRLKVSIAGRPQPTVLWYHNGAEIKPSSRLEISTTDKYSVVRILDATREDRGEYTVKAKNTIGDDLTSFLVTITDRPLPPGKVQVVMTLGRCVTIAWSMPEDDGGCKIGNFIVEYFRIGWNMWLKAATCRQLTTTIGDLIEGSQYKFRVKAENPYGISDPSPESSIIFIPDPKRGLLEPPKVPEPISLDEIPPSDGWSFRQNDKREKPKKLEPWTDDDEHALPSPIILANQVLRKVKLAPKRTWSEDSQGSPPRQSPERPPPIPPKRKHRPTIETQERGRRLERSLSPEMSQVKMKVDRRSLSESQRKPSRPPVEVIAQVENDRKIASGEEKDVEIAEKNKMRSYNKNEKGQWGRELSPNSPNGDETHSSSEMMIVLLPDDTEDAEDRITIDQLKAPSGIAPPMSLSAPVLGGSDPVEPLLRSAASSSELLYELTVARLNKEAEDEETENNLRRRYGIERKRSFERRGSAAGRIKDFKVSSDEHLERRPTKDESPLQNRSPKETTPQRTNNDDNSDFSKRFELLEKNFEKYTKRYFFQEKMSEQGSFERSFDYTEDEEGHDAEDEAEDSEPINTRMAKGTFTPIAVKMPVMEFAERLPSPPHEAYYGIPMITISEEPETEQEKEPSPTPPPVQMRRARSTTPTKTLSASKTREPSPLKMSPKPILKTRDRSAERGDSETEHAQPKKVRIEEPEEKKNIDMYAQKENDIGLFAGEVARNRRKLVRSTVTNDESNDPTKVIVNLYSDIVKEFSQHKKPPSRLYLNYDELKEAADRESHVEPNADIETIEAQARVEKQCAGDEKKLDENQQVSKDERQTTVTLPPRLKMRMEYVLDLFLFLVACWLYIFKDPRLAVPLIILMLYRQLDETLHKKLTFLRRFTNKKTTNQ